MITAINENNRAKYIALFNKATDALKNAAKDLDFTNAHKDFKKENYLDANFTKIETLEQYFNCIGDLKYIDKKFTILPVDEEYFEIDANSRIITIPPNTFKKHGLGVVGDETAEIVYFRIDRYFDFMDLAKDNIKILIQWESDAVEKQVSPIWVKDYDTYTDKLVFGWAIDSNITQVKGPLRFSVRFVMIEGDDILYSLSTQTAQTTINPGLNFSATDLNAANDTVLTRIFNRIKNSDKSSNADIEVPAPIFLLDRFKPALNEKDLIILEDLSDAQGLEAQAYKTVSHGVISYGFQDETKSPVIGENYTINSGLKSSEGRPLSDKIIYYKLNADGTYDVILKDDIIVDEFNKIADSNIYENYCLANINKAGTYYFTATNTYNANKALTVAPNGYFIPGPSKNISVIAEVNVIKENKLTSNDINITNDDVKTTLKYQLEKKDNDTYISTSEELESIDFSLDTEGTYRIKVLASRNNKTEIKYSNDIQAYNRAVVPVFDLTDSSGDNLYIVGESVICNIENINELKDYKVIWSYKAAGEKVETEGVLTNGVYKFTIPQEAIGSLITCEIINKNGFDGNIARTSKETNYVGSANN